MTKQKLSAVVLALAVLTVTGARSAQAVAINVLLNKVPYASAGLNNWGGDAVETMTDGVWGQTGPFVMLSQGGWAAYDLGSVTDVSDLGFLESNNGRAVPNFVTLTFSNTADFAVSTSRTVPLSHVHTPQWSVFDLATGQYVRIALPAGLANYSIDGDDFATPTAEVQLLTPIPEPATLSLLALGGLALRRRARR